MRSRCRLFALGLALVSASALAQDRGFRVHRFDASAVGSKLFLLERPWYSSTRFFAVGVTTDYSHAPLTPRLATGRGLPTPIIENALVGHVDVAGSFLDRFLVSASLPVTLFETGTPELVSQAAPVSGVALGDPRLAAMVRLFGDSERDAFSLHVGADVWVPIGAAPRHQGDVGVRVMPRVIAAGALGLSRYTLDLAFLIRPYSSLGPPALGMTAAPEARVGLAVGLSLLDDSLYVGPELRFSSQVIGANAFSFNGMSFEMLGGANVLVADNVFVGAAVGTAILGAAGTPDLRGVVRLAWAPRRSSVATGPITLPASIGDDGDQDGVPDSVDRCPFEPESKNGVRDQDGCPEFDGDAGTELVRILSARPLTPSPLPEGEGASSPPAPVSSDVDGDGVDDWADRCPVTAEDPDGFEDDDGCPELDNDLDFIADADDKCPLAGETFNGIDDYDGCPDLAPDVDGDGVADAIDRCPLEPENVDGLRDDDGCPEYVLVAAANAPPTAVLALARILSPPPPRVAEAIGAKLDSDKDAIDDEADRCPVTPEDPDGFEDEDGCPEPDNDDDGIADKLDACPMAAETLNGWEDLDGCPDEHGDVDDDGVVYALDRCPLEPGDKTDGCPHLPPPALALAGFSAAAPSMTDLPPANASTADFDKDGTPDADDKCPLSAEDKDGFEDEDGCPEPDNDFDGVDDKKDKCPFEAETINGNRDDDGCPDPGTSRVHVVKGTLVLDETVQFKTGSAALLPASNKLLKQVAGVLRGARTLSIEIQGHTDDVGSASNNIKLSQKRAEAIRTFLVKEKLAATRLRAVGYGPTKPRATNATAEGREQNRRVEFLIIGEAK